MGAPVQVNVAAQHQFRAPKLTLCLGFAFMPSVESWCLEGDGPGRCERGVRGHNRDRAFRLGKAGYSYAGLGVDIKD